MPATSCPPPGTAIAGAPGEGKTVALTFDDGVGPSSLAIAEVLKSRGVTATFFDTGRHDDADRADVRQLAVWGFAIEDHSWDHLYPQEVPGGWSLAYLRDQITRTADLQQQLTGRRPCYFRPPGGFRMNVAPVVNSLGMSLVPWSIDTEDWRQPATTTDAATQAIIERATAIGTQQHPIVLMHASKASHEPDSVVSPNRSNTVAALPAIIDWYQVHGFRFVAY